MKVETRRGLVLALHMLAAHRVEGINTVIYMNLMPAPAERPSETIDIGGIPSEAVRPEERSDHAELHRRPPCRIPGAFASPQSGRSPRSRPWMQHHFPQLHVAQAAETEPDRNVRYCAGEYG